MAAINDPVEECEDLSLPLNHPGLHDVNYLRRRKMFYFLAREHRKREMHAPEVVYTSEESEVWRTTFEELDGLHATLAASVFQHGKKDLGLSASKIPGLRDLEGVLRPKTGVQLVPAEGLLHGKAYFEYWSKRTMPCTQFLRHPGHPEYTPEPDIIHDVIGHVPPLMNQEYAGLIERIGRAACGASPEELERIVRFYWFTIEFGLIEEAGEVRILGAGILSSIEEMRNVAKGIPQLRPFRFEDVMEQSFDTTNLQPILFVAPSLDEIARCAERLRG